MDSLPMKLRNVTLALAVLCLVYSRCSLTGIRSMFHYILESPLCILVDTAYAMLTYPSGTELGAIIFNVNASASRTRTLVYVAVILRPFTTPTLLLTKAVLSLRNGFREVSYCITIKESVAIIIVQMVVLSNTSSDLVAVGMKANTTSDQMTQYLWRFHGAMLAATLAVITFRFMVGRAVDQYLRKRLGTPLNRSSTALEPNVKRGNLLRPTQMGLYTLTSSEMLPYDEYLGGKFFGFGVCMLPYETVRGRLCRVLDGSSLWMEAIFNFNLNGLTSYHQVLRPGHVVEVSCIGQFSRSTVELETERQRRSGNVYIG